MIGTYATADRHGLGGVPEALLHEEPAAARSGPRARAVDPSDPLDAAWAGIGNAVTGARADHRRALDMMCD